MPTISVVNCSMPSGVIRRQWRTGRRSAGLNRRAGREPELERPLHAGPDINLQLPALLPDDYLPDVSQRLRLYKRIASAADAGALADLQSEMVDRFGTLPGPARTLFRIAALRLRAAPLGILRLEAGPLRGLVEFGEDPGVDPARVIRLVQQDPKRYRLDGSHRIRFSIPSGDERGRLKMAQDLLDELGAAS